MDTREKIVSVSQARQVAQAWRQEGVPFHVVAGYFDVLQPEMVRDLRRLTERGARLFAVVLEPEKSILPAGARRELAAALRMIDYVVRTGADTAKDLLIAMHPDEIIHCEQKHKEIAERLIEHVFERHGRLVERRSGN